MAEKATLTQVKDKILKMVDKPEELKKYLDKTMHSLKGPSITSFLPRKGYPGTILEIEGKNFSAIRETNEVTVGGKPATVVEASQDRLRAITDSRATTGSVEVSIGEKRAVAPYDFQVMELPNPEADGPPVIFAGRDLALPGTPKKGIWRVLFILVYPSDRPPKDKERARKDILKTKEDLEKFYDQASYGRLKVDVDITKGWHELSGTLTDYINLKYEDIVVTSLDRLMAEAAQASMDEGLNINSYLTVAAIINLNGSFVRGRGGWSCQAFQYYLGGKHIDIVASHEINLIAIQESANWGRFAHELGHGLVSRPKALWAPPTAAVLSEDVYSTDLVDISAATAQDFDMMGRHDRHPLFSGYYMDQLGWYRSDNTLSISWNRNAFCRDYELAAHGAEENSDDGRYHLIKIEITKGLYYYIEVRQRPGPTDQIFDDFLPLGKSSPAQGGVVVTKVLAGTMNINQQMRFITLMHSPHVLGAGAIVTDPERSIKITVMDSLVQERPLVCRVRIEWAMGDPEDPNGAFDLRIEPWNKNWECPDIWVDRVPFGEYEEPLDDEGRPTGNGDKPKPLEINHIWARAHCDGLVGAKDVRVTFYAVEPPNIGDNGNWAPLQTNVLPSIDANGYADTHINWVPAVGLPTAIKVWIDPKPGEVTADNNFSQENVLKFEAPAESPPRPVIVPVIVCNPLEKKSLAIIEITGVPEGFTVHFPHRWVWLHPLQRRLFHLMVVPSQDYDDYGNDQAQVVLTGYIPQDFEAEPSWHNQASVMEPIGGVQVRVVPKRIVDISLEEDLENSTETTIVVKGSIAPPLKGERIRVGLVDPDDEAVYHVVTTEADGTFKATLDLPSIYPRRQYKGVYVCRAMILGSPKAADGAIATICCTKGPCL